MPNHLSTRQVSELVARRLAPQELRAAIRHLAECDACRTRVNQAHQTEALLSALPALLQGGFDATAAEHLSYEQLSGFVDQSQSDGERAEVKNHLDVCGDCSARAQELEEVWAQIRTGSDNAIESAASAPSQRQKTSIFTALAGRWPKVSLAAIAIAAIIFGFSWWRKQSHNAYDNTVSQIIASPAPAGTFATAPAPAAVPTSSDTVVALTDHDKTVGLDSQGNLIGLSSLPPSYAKLVKATLEKQRPPIPSNADLTPGKGTLLGSNGDANSFSLLTPVGNVVLTDRPKFRWQTMAGAESYSVAVSDRDLNPMSQSEPIRGTSWTPLKPLPRDQVLLWQVTAKVGESQIVSPTPPSPEARFRILSQAKSAELSRAAIQYADSHLLLGALYAEAGLTAEAEREFRALLAENPDSRLAQNLLRSVRGSKPRG